MGRIHNIEGRKNKQDSKRAAVFTKYARLITVAVKEGGPDPEYNASLKTAIEKAKARNMPNDNIERAIKKGTGAGDSENFESIVYEGYGPGGVAMIIETLTDNKNRTAGNVRYYLDKNGGNLGTSGCVSFMFDRKGIILIKKSEEDGFEIYTDPSSVYEVKDAIQTKGYDILSAEVSMIPQTYTAVEGSAVKQLEKLLDMLDDDDDIQEVYTNQQV